MARKFNQDAYAIMRRQFREYGLQSLAPKIKQMLIDGRSAAEIELDLQDTPEWKNRFRGNEMLKNNGQPVLSVAEYLAAEKSYGQIMKQFGLPTGFYDDPEDFAKWIGNSVSPSEVQERVAAWSDLANRQDPAVKEQLKAMGMTDGDLTAFMMDPKRANPLIQRKYQQTVIGAAARRTGTPTSNAYAARLAELGLSEQEAQQGYAVISEGLETMEDLGDIYGEDYDQRDFESEIFEGSGESTRKRKRLASQERAAFSGSSGVRGGSLGSSGAGQY